MRIRFLLGLLLLLASVAHADVRQAHQTVLSATREYLGLLTAADDGNIESIRDRIVPQLVKCQPKFAAMVVRSFNKAFESKYKRSDHFQKCVARMMAADPRTGIPTLYRHYRAGASKKKPALRRSIAEALGECGFPVALDKLLRILLDHEPEVVAAAAKGCASYAKVSEKKRKAAVKKIIERYSQITSKASGKQPESGEMKLYTLAGPILRRTLTAFTGDDLDSAEAWKAWWRDHATKSWD